MAVIEPYNPERDAKEVFALWQVALGEEWPITLDLFLRVVHSAKFWQNCHFVAREGEEIVGFVAAQVQQTVQRSEEHTSELQSPC